MRVDSKISKGKRVNNSLDWDKFADLERLKSSCTLLSCSKRMLLLLGPQLEGRQVLSFPEKTVVEVEICIVDFGQDCLPTHVVADYFSSR